MTKGQHPKFGKRPQFGETSLIFTGSPREPRFSPSSLTPDLIFEEWAEGWVSHHPSRKSRSNPRLLAPCRRTMCPPPRRVRYHSTAEALGDYGPCDRRR